MTDRYRERDRERERERTKINWEGKETERQKEVEKQTDGARDRVSCREADRTGTVAQTGIDIAANQTNQPAQGKH